MGNFYHSLAKDIFANEFESNTGAISLSQISGWLSSHIGGLNTLIHTNFSGDDPLVDSSAADIFYKQYLKDYNNKAARNALRGVLSSSNGGDNILSVSDGDNKISFVNKREVALSFQNAAKELSTEIDSLAYKYTLHASSPLQVVGIDGFISGYYPYNTDPPRRY